MEDYLDEKVFKWYLKCFSVLVSYNVVALVFRVVAKKDHF